MIGGWVVDIFLGRYNIIYGSFLLYVVGIIILVVVIFDYGVSYGLSIGSKEVFFGILLLFIFVGIGGIKVNVFFLGAD